MKLISIVVVILLIVFFGVLGTILTQNNFKENYGHYPNNICESSFSVIGLPTLEYCNEIIKQRMMEND